MGHHGIPRSLFLLLPLALAAGWCLENLQAESKSFRAPVLADRADKGYRVRASGDWQLKAAPPPLDCMIQRQSPFCVVNFNVVDAGGLTAVNESIMEAVFSQVQKQYKNSKVLAKKVEQLHGKPSCWYELQGELEQHPGVPLRIRQYLVLQGKRMVIVTVSTPAAEWQTATPHWEKIVEDLEFVDPK